MANNPECRRVYLIGGLVVASDVPPCLVGATEQPQGVLMSEAEWAQLRAKIDILIECKEVLEQ